MVYKKFIIKNGRKYGPYTYHSKRVDGRVVSEYHGKRNGIGSKFNFDFNKNYLVIFLGLILAIILVYFGVSFFNQSITGKAALSLETTYFENESLQGALRLLLKEGELLPGSSIVKVETASNTYEFPLSELIDEETTTGSFYVEGKTISGTGEGFGEQGTANVPVEVTFTLDIQTESISEEKETKSSTETTTEEEITEETPSETTESSNETEISEESPVEVTETPKETQTPTEETPSEVTETPTTTEPETTEESSETTTEETTETSSETTTEETIPITGNIIQRFFGAITNFFLGITPTGKVTLKTENSVGGETSKTKSYTYTLSDGQTASIKKNSVKVNGEEISDDEVSISVENNVATVTTDYTKESQGFGEDYLGNTAKTLNIDLEQLNIPAEKGNLKVSLVFEGEEIVSVNSIIEVEGETTTSTNITESEASNETITEIPLSIELSEQEKEILVEKFGNDSVKTTKAEVINDRLIVKYELDKYWIEYSYEYDGTVDSIGNLMERDKARWLKDLAAQLSKTKEEPQEINDLIGNEFNITGIKSVEIVSNITINNEEEEVVEEETPEEEIPVEEVTEENAEETIAETTENVTEAETIQESNESTTPITGNAVAKTGDAVKGFFEGIINFFKG